MDNKSFWYYFLSVNFPQAYDEANDIDISDIIEEYNPDNEWIDKFVKYSEDVFEENDGYVDNPNTVELNLNGHDFRIEFHPGDTIFFIDGQEIGCTGGHFILKKIDFQLFSELTQGYDSLTSLLVLPMISLENDDIQPAEDIIKSALETLELRKEHIIKITDMIIKALT